jgi:hypothetical protein
MVWRVGRTSIGLIITTPENHGRPSSEADPEGRELAAVCGGRCVNSVAAELKLGHELLEAGGLVGQFLS